MTADAVHDPLVAVTGRYRLVAVEEAPEGGVRVRLQEAKTGQIVEVPSEELARNKALLYAMLPETNHQAAHVSGILTGKSQMFPLVNRLEEVVVRHSGRLRFVVFGAFALGILAGIGILEFLARN